MPDMKKWLLPLNNSLKPKASNMLHALFLSTRIGPQDIARFECVNGIAILENTVPTAFRRSIMSFSTQTFYKEFVRR
ncbi:uncharacterized protein K441DRAFT_661814 [Cenococcum geophilum 1.58]|uniref:uncharacterized protein n=1 Tax=Cenococcum geophilum 1.58 TaxID=794803 RepID=UPI00358F10CF|nr:hypothetical protein K441DRAFT_661814 [Cenococcum geophilum 1.58]